MSNPKASDPYPDLRAEMENCVKDNPELLKAVQDDDEILIKLLGGGLSRTIEAYPHHVEQFEPVPGWIMPKLCVFFLDEQLSAAQQVEHRLFLDRLMNSSEGWAVVKFGCDDDGCTSCYERQRGAHPRVELHINRGTSFDHDPCLSVSMCVDCDREGLDQILNKGRGFLGSHIDVATPGDTSAVYPSRNNAELPFLVDVEASREAVELATTYFEPNTAGSE